MKTDANPDAPPPIGRVRARVKARRMTSGEATHISLVDEPASRLPFRVTKRTRQPHDETRSRFPMFPMTALQKRATQTGPADIFAIVTRKANTAAMAARLQQLGLSTDDVVREKEVTIFRQEAAKTTSDYASIQLDDDTLVLLAGADIKKRMQTYGESPVFAETVAASGFMPSLYVAMSALEDTVRAGVYAETADRGEHRDMLKSAVDDFGGYVMTLFDALPETVFRMCDGQAALFATAMKSVTGSTVHKIIQRPPEQDDGETKIDHSLAPNQQAAGRAAADAEPNPSEKQHAYNLAAAQTEPEWPEAADGGYDAGKSDKDVSTFEGDDRTDTDRPTALNRPAMHDTGRETSNAVDRGHDSTFSRPGEPLEGSHGAIESPEVESQGKYPYNVDSKTNLQTGGSYDPEDDTGTDPGTGADTTGDAVEGDEAPPAEQEGTAGTTNEAGSGAEPSSETGTGGETETTPSGETAEANSGSDTGSADSGADGAAGDGSSTETKSADGTIAALIRKSMGDALAPLVTEVRTIGKKVGELDERTVRLGEEHERLNGAVLGAADQDDPLSAYGSTVAKGGEADPWAGLFEDAPFMSGRRGH